MEGLWHYLCKTRSYHKSFKRFVTHYPTLSMIQFSLSSHSSETPHLRGIHTLNHTSILTLLISFTRFAKSLSNVLKISRNMRKFIPKSIIINTNIPRLSLFSILHTCLASRVTRLPIQSPLHLSLLRLAPATGLLPPVPNLILPLVQIVRTPPLPLINPPHHHFNQALTSPPPRPPPSLLPLIPNLMIFFSTTSHGRHCDLK